MKPLRSSMFMVLRTGQFVAACSRISLKDAVLRQRVLAHGDEGTDQLDRGRVEAVDGLQFVDAQQLAVASGVLHQARSPAHRSAGAARSAPRGRCGSGRSGPCSGPISTSNRFVRSTLLSSPSPLRRGLDALFDHVARNPIHLWPCDPRRPARQRSGPDRSGSFEAVVQAHRSGVAPSCERTRHGQVDVQAVPAEARAEVPLHGSPVLMPVRRYEHLVRVVFHTDAETLRHGRCPSRPPRSSATCC